MPDARGTVERYEQWNIDPQSVVDFAGMSFWGADGIAECVFRICIQNPWDLKHRPVLLGVADVGDELLAALRGIEHLSNRIR